MLLVAIDFEHVAVAKGFYTPLGRWLRRISSVREAAAELEEAQDASGVLTLEETERRAELQEEPPPAPRVSVGCAGGGGGGDDSGSEDDDSGSGSGSEATASESEDGEDKKADKSKDGGEDKKSDGGEAQRRPRVASSRGSSVDPLPCKRSRVAQSSDYKCLWAVKWPRHSPDEATWRMSSTDDCATRFCSPSLHHNVLSVPKPP